MEMQMFSFRLDPDAYYPIPQHLLNSLERYLNHGIMPGGFLTAVLENNLCEAFGRADIHSSQILKEIVGYIYNHLPSGSWGSREKVREWQAKAFAASAEDNAA
jgi:hypothetical protein